MTPLALAGVGAIAIVGGAIVLRSFGRGYRLGRLLATVRPIPISAAIDAARSHQPAYVRIDGRVDSETDFEDEHHRPLVFRRRRLEVHERRGWRAVSDEREVVPFEIRDRLVSIAIDTDALGDGLVVIPREAVGTAADARPYLPPDVPDADRVRLLVEQVSSVEHAVALGVPIERPDGSVALTAGFGRPLVLATLEPDEAIRMLAGGRRTRPIIAAGLLGGGLVTLLAAGGWALVDAIR